jgi:hypothetical protein
VTISTLMTDRPDFGTAALELAARLGCELHVYYPNGYQPSSTPAAAEAGYQPFREAYDGVECMTETEWRGSSSA